MVYYGYFNSIMKYGLIFFWNASHSAKNFKIQKNVIRILTGYKSRDLGGNLLKNLKILPLQSQYTISLILCVSEEKQIKIKL